MMNFRRRLSLIETLVSCSIICVVFSMFISSFLNLTRSSLMLSKVSKEIYKTIFIDLSLKDLIESIAPPFEKILSNNVFNDQELAIWSTVHTDISGSELFFVSRPSGGKYHDLTNYVSCHLHVENSVLILDVSQFWYFADDSNKSYRTSLVKDVADINFEFYLPPKNGVGYGRVVKSITEGSFEFPRMIKINIIYSDSRIDNFFFTIYANPFLFRVD